MEIKTGYLYHIKDEYFDVVNDDSLMQNHERGKKRPTYFTIKDKDILWFIPISSKIDKYQKIIDNKIKKYDFTNPLDQIYFHMWKEEQFPYSEFNIDIDSYKRTTNNEKVVKGLEEWKLQLEF